MPKLKHKGAFLYNVGWHQDSSALVVPKVAEQVLVYGKRVDETVINWPDQWDFYMRVKVPRTSRLHGTYNGEEFQLPNTTRFYVAKGGVTLTKIMPPLKNKTEWRRIGICTGRTVCPINHIKTAVLPIDYAFYISEVDKLVLPLRKFED